MVILIFHRILKRLSKGKSSNENSCIESLRIYESEALLCLKGVNVDNDSSNNSP